MNRVTPNWGTICVTLVFLSGTGPFSAAQAFIPRSAVLHATATVTGDASFSGSYDVRLRLRTCADVVKHGTTGIDQDGNKAFQVPTPSPGAGPYAVGSGHDFDTDAAVGRYPGPGAFSGTALTATEMTVNTRPDQQETHHFAFPKDIGKIVVNPDASGSFVFSGLRDPAGATISGQVSWTCSEH